MTEATPVATLTAAGMKSLPWELWQTVTHHGGQTFYEYVIEFAATRAIRELAYLSTEGWEVHVRPHHRALQIRVYRSAG